MLINYFTIFTVYSFCFLSLVLFFKKTSNRGANQILAASFLMLGYIQFSLFLFHTRLIFDYHFFLNIDFLVLPLFSIFLYLYALRMTGERVNWNYKMLVHLPVLLPGLIYIIAFRFIYTTHAEVYKYLNDALIKLPWQVTLINAFDFTASTFYFLISYRHLRNYRKRTRMTSEKNAIQLKWLENSFGLLLLLCILTVPASLLAQNEFVNQALGQLSVWILCVYFFYKTVNSSVIFSHPIEFKSPNLAMQSTEKYIKSSLTKNEAEIIKEKLLEIFETQKPYLNPDLSLRSLSEYTGSNIHLLSQVINQEFEVNFADLINSYRVQHAKKLLLEENYSNHTIEAIGYDSGFGTKTSFNIAFKKHSGQTPSEYRKKAKIGNIFFN